MTARESKPELIGIRPRIRNGSFGARFDLFERKAEDSVFLDSFLRKSVTKHGIRVEMQAYSMFLDRFFRKSVTKHGMESAERLRQRVCQFFVRLNCDVWRDLLRPQEPAVDPERVPAGI